MGYYGNTGVVYGVKEFDVYGLEGLGGLGAGANGDFRSFYGKRFGELIYYIYFCTKQHLFL